MRVPDSSLVFYELSSLVSILVLAATLTSHYFSWHDIVQIDLYKDEQSILWARYDVYFTHSTWLFYIGSCVLIGQVLWLSYACVLPCRARDENSVYQTFVISHSVLMMFAFSLASTLGWLFLWVEGTNVKYAAIFLLIAVVLSAICLVLTVFRLRRHQYKLIQMGHNYHVWAIRILVFNGLSSLFTFLSILLFYNIGAVLKEDALYDDITIVYLVMSLVALYTVVFFVIDVMCCAVTRWTHILPYCVLGILQVATVQKNQYNDAPKLLTCSSVVLGMMITMLCVRTAMSVQKRGISMIQVDSYSKEHTVVDQNLPDVSRTGPVIESNHDGTHTMMVY